MKRAALKARITLVRHFDIEKDLRGLNCAFSAVWGDVIKSLGRLPQAKADIAPLALHTYVKCHDWGKMGV